MVKIDKAFRDEQNDDDSAYLSKTKRKEQATELQDLGVELIATSLDKLRKLDLPTELFDAIREAKRLTANGAVRRQRQYVGKLMRDVDAVVIREQLDYLNGDSIKSNQVFHLVEKWRDELLSDDEALVHFVALYPNFEISELRNLIRSVRKERLINKVRNYTKLFRLIKTILEENGQ